VYEKLPAAERSKFAAYVKREELPDEAYRPFGNAACQQLRAGQPKQAVVENGAQFFGPTISEAIVEAAIEEICPGLRR
jgi:hypothetical protein